MHMTNVSSPQATGGCYPLDTIRRQMQLKSSAHANVLAAATAIVARDGVGGLYRGFLPNAAKNLPNSSIRLSTFDAAKKLLVFSRNEMRCAENTPEAVLLIVLLTRSTAPR
jgi:solute carrier family 25 phosphate transporter 23/24/25/41